MSEDSVPPKKYEIVVRDQDGHEELTLSGDEILFTLNEEGQRVFKVTNAYLRDYAMSPVPGAYRDGRGTMTDPADLINPKHWRRRQWTCLLKRVFTLGFATGYTQEDRDQAKQIQTYCHQVNDLFNHSRRAREAKDSADKLLELVMADRTRIGQRNRLSTQSGSVYALAKEINKHLGRLRPRILEKRDVVPEVPVEQ